MVWIVWLITSKEKAPDLVVLGDCQCTDVDFIHVIAAEDHKFFFVICCKFHT